MNQLATNSPKCADKATVVLSTQDIYLHQAFAAAMESSRSGGEKLLLDDIPPPRHPAGVIGDYELLEVIAQGGMGVIYKARQRRLNRIVALKLLLGGNHAGADFKRRFQQEAETVAKLKHPNIVPIYEIGEHEQQPFFSMEYVAGKDFARLVNAQPLPAKTAAQYLLIITDAIAYAHQQGVLHRDLKPSNILLGLDDRPRVTDFGLSRQLDMDSSLTSSGTMLGTPGYMPPEQASIKRGQTGAYSDVYSLGALLYHMLTGRAPFIGGTIADILQEVLHKDPVSPRQLNPKVPVDLETICLKCMRKPATERYSSAQLLADDLGRFLRNEPIQARKPPLYELIAKWYQRQPFAAGLLLTLILGIGVGGWKLNSLYSESRSARLEASQQAIISNLASHRAERAQAKSDLLFNFTRQIEHETRRSPDNPTVGNKQASIAGVPGKIQTPTQVSQTDVQTVTLIPVQATVTAYETGESKPPRNRGQSNLISQEAVFERQFPFVVDDTLMRLADNPFKQLLSARPKEFEREMKREFAALKELSFSANRRAKTESNHSDQVASRGDFQEISLPSSLTASVAVKQSDVTSMVDTVTNTVPVPATDPRGWGRVKLVRDNQVWISLGAKDGINLADKVRIFLPRITNDFRSEPKTNFLQVAEITVSFLRKEESMGTCVLPIDAGWPALAPSVKIK